MTAWKRKDWETFKGTWFIVSSVLTDEQITALIESNPDKYGDLKDWSKRG
jgi:hypothetical protein